MVSRNIEIGLSVFIIIVGLFGTGVSGYNWWRDVDHGMTLTNSKGSLASDIIGTICAVCLFLIGVWYIFHAWARPV